MGWSLKRNIPLRFETNRSRDGEQAGRRLVASLLELGAQRFAYSPWERARLGRRAMAGLATGQRCGDSRWRDPMVGRTAVADLAMGRTAAMDPAIGRTTDPVTEEERQRRAKRSSRRSRGGGVPWSCGR